MTKRTGDALIKMGIKYLLCMTLVAACVSLTGCNSEEGTEPSENFNSLKFVVNVSSNDGVAAIKGTSLKKGWKAGDKIVVSIDNDDSNICNLEFLGGSNWRVSKYNDNTNFGKESGTLSAIYSDHLFYSPSGTTVGGDILYTKKGNYKRHDNVVEINLNMDTRPVSRIVVTGIDKTFWIDNIEEYSKVGNLSVMNFTTSSTEHKSNNREVYGDTVVFYGRLQSDASSNTEIILKSTGGALCKRTFPGKTLKAGESILVEGPMSEKDYLWTTRNIPVIGITSVRNITLSEGQSIDCKSIYTLAPQKPSNAKVSVISSAPDIVAVEGDRTLNALAKGTANITFTSEDGNFKSEAVITVTDVTDSIQLSHGSGIFTTGRNGYASFNGNLIIRNNNSSMVHLNSLTIDTYYQRVSIDKDLKPNETYSVGLRMSGTDINVRLQLTHNGKEYTCVVPLYYIVSK